MAYKENETVQQAREQLEKQETARPGAYTSQWSDRVRQTIDSILNREDFSYEANKDPLYRQSVQEHLRAGQAAMAGAMGQTAAQAGGYGTSYAQNVGQQVYQGHVQQTNEMIPALYQLALSKYGLDSDELHRKAALMGEQENRDYASYMDSMDQWRMDRDWLYDQYNTERAFDYGKHRDTVSDEQWQAEFDEALRQWQLQWDAAHAKDVGGGGGSSGGRGDRRSSDDEWASGIDTTRNQSGLKGSAWDYTLHNLKQLVNSGSATKANQYMDKVADKMNESQFNEAIKVISKK